MALTAGLLGTALGGAAGALRPGQGGAPAAEDRAGTSPPGRAPVRRWSGDGWVLLRREGNVASLATGAGSYGGSQFGAVVRYALQPGSARAPQLYLRGTGAIGRAPDRGVAAGFAMRPAPRIPATLMIEARVDQTYGGGVIVRPAVAVVGGFGPRPGLQGLELEGYGQAGWVGGRESTAFFDLQAVADRRLVKPFAGADLRLGAGVWAGGQRGAARVDAGPRLTLRTTVAGAPSRLALDWRFRVAGQAEPGSGPALTLATGF
jgi:hypothetical protein